MVPCQPRQLVIFSLPFAALVVFFWYKRRRNSSHSDPGGSPVPTEPVDKPADDNCHIQAGSEILCNGSTDAIKQEPDQSDRPSTPCGIFHSTVIEDEKDIEEIDKPSPVKSNHPVEESVISCNVQLLESLDNIQNICTEKEDGDNDSVKQKYTEDFQSIPIEEQSTLENIVLKNKVIAEDLLEENIEVKSEVISENNQEESEHPEQYGVLNSLTDDSVQSDFNTRENSSTLSEGTEESSTDTGLGSQDLSGAEETVMAQGQKTEEKTESNAGGLEQKLASLGLDTQQPAPRAERDSANHSPAEVMLNSPAISNFSDAHSEGSSDSGKGCSDVVTPPSRTPAGGSSVAGDQVPILYEFVLPQVIVGRLIGRHGTFLHDIRAKTHTSVFIKRHPETNSLKICAIEGTQQDIDAALKMIRQKFPLRRFPELTLERASFVKPSCLPISPDNMQLHLVEGVNNDVLLSSLITAGHFFLQLPMHMSYQSLYRLACIMNTVYNTQESPPLPDPQPDVVCVVPAHGGWYRAQILSVDEEAHTSDIRFLDYGGFLTVDNSQLRQIRGDFLLLPFQAVECALANVLPSGGEEWSEDAKQFVQLMTTQQTLQAQVYEYTDTGVPLVYLYCTQFYQSPTDPGGFETKVVLLNQELVSHGYAELIDAWQEDIDSTQSS